jgi:predicted nucleic acid-binding protein
MILVSHACPSRAWWQSYLGLSPSRQRRAQSLLETAATAGTILVSTQVLQEFFVTVTRKLSPPLSAKAALEVVDELANLPLVQVDPEIILKAGDLTAREPVSFWDALIVSAAAAGGAPVVYSEDMQDGWKVAGVTVVDPFARSATD